MDRLFVLITLSSLLATQALAAPPVDYHMYSAPIENPEIVNDRV